MAKAPGVTLEEGALVEVPVCEVVRGDRLPVGTGEVIPVDDRLVGTAVLYGLHAILRLHNAQDEGAFSLVHEPSPIVAAS